MNSVLLNASLKKRKKERRYEGNDLSEKIRISENDEQCAFSEEEREKRKIWRKRFVRFKIRRLEFLKAVNRI